MISSIKCAFYKKGLFSFYILFIVLTRSNIAYNIRSDISYSTNKTQGLNSPTNSSDTA